MRLGFQTIAAGLLCTAPLSAQFFTIDPINGVNSARAGSPSSPLKTITFATRLVPPRTGAVFLLRPGTYSEASGETFPIELPDLCWIGRDPVSALDGRQVRIQTTLGLQTTLSIRPSTLADITISGVVMTGGQFRSVQMIVDGVPGISMLRLQDCRMTQSRCVAVRANRRSHVVVEMNDCRLAGFDAPVIAAIESEGSTITLAMDRCEVLGGLGAGILLDASNGGEIRAALRACRIQGQTARGLHSVSGNGSSIQTRIEHCQFHDVARFVVGSATTLGGMVDTLLASGNAPQHVVVNSVFFDNREDIIPPRSFTGYRFGTNLVEQTNLIGLGNNILGNPSFLADGTFRTAPGSPARDLGDAADVTLASDLFGAPRLDPSSGLPDLGVGEYHQGFVYFDGPTIRTGARSTTFTTNVMAPPGDPFLLLVGVGGRTGTFGPGALHILPPFSDIGLSGISDTTGYGEVSLTVPLGPTMIGVAIDCQSITATAPHLGANAAGVLFVD